MAESSQAAPNESIIEGAHFLFNRTKLEFSVDPLSDVLSLLRVESMLSSHFEGRGPWGFRFPASEAQLKFGCVIAGCFSLSVEGAGKEPLSLSEGDFYLLTNGRAIRSSSAPAFPVRDGLSTYRKHRCEDGVVRYGASGPLVSLASGRFTFAGDAAGLFLRHLPPLIHLRAGTPGTESLAGLLQLLKSEVDDARAGATVARASLASLVLVHVLRAFLGSSPQPEGWLGAMSDTRVGTALSEMHGDLMKPWTVEMLARTVGMSRTAFAVRFKRLVGASPLDYLSAWRMQVARRALVEGDEAIARVAEQVGYVSDTAFSAAFKRATGQSPGRFRADQRLL